MKIISWNIKRPKIGEKRNDEILRIIGSQNADLIFLTETNSIIELPGYHKIQSQEIKGEYEGIDFNKGENQVSIYSKYPIFSEIQTDNSFSNICGEIKTESGDLLLYGSVIGFLGGRTSHFKMDLIKIKEDLIRLNHEHSICLSGDLNISFSGYPYPNKKVQMEMLDFFDELGFEILTKSINDSAIHIVLSKKFIRNRKFKVYEVEIKKEISDHHLVVAEISPF